jgi:exodeoxyribonuclease V beta subunit
LLDAWLPAGDPLAGYAERLREPGLRRDLRGYLTGTLDLVLRAGGRYTVVDYKTNWLGGAGEELRAWHYRPAALAETMHHSHYALQALLYLVALHRYLRWRVAGYDPAGHLGGVAYLFLRGMTGPDAPVVDGGRCGVFAWQPPAGLVPALSDLLDRGRVCT